MHPETEASGVCSAHRQGHLTYIAFQFASAVSRADDRLAYWSMSDACFILQGNEEAKPAGLAHPVPATEDSMDNDQTGMAADVAPAALTDVPTGVHADKAAAAHLTERTGEQYLTCCFKHTLLHVLLSQRGMLSEGCRFTQHPAVHSCAVSTA